MPSVPTQRAAQETPLLILELKLPINFSPVFIDVGKRAKYIV